MSGYIGTQPVPQATQTRDAFTATNNQTSFPTSGYTPEFLDVFLNGVKLAAADYTATNGSDVVLAAGATTGDILEVVSYGTFEVLNPTFDGNVTFTGNASFGDNDKAIFGDGSDLQIYHDGSHSRILDNGTGDLYLQGNNLYLTNTAGNNYFGAISGGAASLYHNNAAKLATTSTGVTVTGTVAATAYTGDGSNLTGVGSPSIDDNGNATAMTITSDENILIGKTSSSLSTNGTELQASGTSLFTRSVNSGDGAGVAYFQRNTSDGNIIMLYNSSTSHVGSIGVNNSLTYITTDGGSGSGSGITFDSSGVLPTTRLGGVVDNAFNLGSSSTRFKDAYLSGGIYLGGTGSANKLEDYEEGTWTPVLSDNSGNNFTMGTQQGFYTKVGNVVTVYFNAQFSNTGSASGLVRFKGFPFTAKNNSGGYYYTGSTINTNGQLSVSLPGNETSAIFHDASSGAGQVSEFNNDRVNGCLTYIAS